MSQRNGDAKVRIFQDERSRQRLLHLIYLLFFTFHGSAVTFEAIHHRSIHFPTPHPSISDYTDSFIHADIVSEADKGR